MATFTMKCPWCDWFGMSAGVADDHPADFLKHDFVVHVEADHPESLDVAKHIEPEYSEPAKKPR